MEFQEWMKDVTPEDMPNDDLKFVAETAGIKSALIMILLLSGLTVTIPKNALKSLKEKHILNEYDGTKFSLNKLTVQCGLSQRYVYNLIKKNLKSKEKKS